MKTDDTRQIGRTTHQIINAPQGAIFVWPFLTSLNYPKEIARKQGRDDLEIIAECQFRESKVMGRRDVDCVIDHATRLSAEGGRALRCIAYRVHARSKKEAKP